MKKTITINLNANIFHIDEDAYELLKSYLRSIESHFLNSDERKEIMADIEARLAELFRAGSANPNMVVTIEDVEKVIGILGRPEEIAGEESAASGKEQYVYSRPRRLYRDIDNRIFGGVCSGLAAFFDIDVLLARILAVLLVFAGGGGLIVYIILWIFVPAAVTTAQKLEMRGEPVTIRNIGKAVREEFEQVKKNLKL